MKKLMFIHHWGGIGGAGVSLIQNLEMLKSSYDIVVYCPNYPEEMGKILKEKGFQVKLYDFSIASIPYYSGGSNIFKPSFYRNVIGIKRQKKTWEQIIQNENPDIVLVNSLILLWLGEVIRKVGKKSVCFVRETFIEKKTPLNTYLIKTLNTDFDGVFFISKYDLNKANLDNTFTAVINDCIKPYRNFNKEKQYNTNEFTLLYVGGFNRLKGISILIKSMQILRDNQNIKLKIAGYYPNDKKKNYHSLFEIANFKNRVLSFIKKNNLSKNIEFIGLQKDLSKEYRESDVLVFPSTKPHQARPVFEAGFFGVPVIISDFIQTKEFVQDRVNGLTFTPNNPVMLAKKIELLYNNEKLKKQLGEENRKQSFEIHSFDVVKEKLLLSISKIES